MEKKEKTPKKEKSEIELLTEISEKIDKLTALSAIQGREEERQTKILRSLGSTYEEISKLTGISKGTLLIRNFRKKKGIKENKNDERRY